MTIGIGPSTPVTSQSTSGSRTQGVLTTGTEKGESTTSSSGSSKPSSQLSTLAQQLSDSALRAEERDASLDRKALGQKADALLQPITRDFHLHRAKYDAEVPNTDDPELLDRAKQATSFVSGRGSNPFSGLSQDQLALIIYDDSGTFTANERKAAWKEEYDQETARRLAVIARGKLEYEQTGKMTEFFKEVLGNYNELPPIMQAQYPDFYAPRLEHLIEMDFNFMTHRAEGKGAPEDIFDILMSSEDFANLGKRFANSTVG
ncbi:MULTISPECIES: hypothetical protein [Halomonadaceae]|uniref:hypothetical protein n=1 Tax=Halomonadaceae TaxID=28256 RepID=UPI0012EFB5F2|nr:MULTISPECIES: hypothetical protein [Halomonas]CAD5269569.1 conserved hypothetical protein [Halomonas sp. 156]CAD5281155.1 conserved hypothetical protein [Halomonas sp. 113]CAD5282588.1 conserved hypothetical protein [Halomonas sp. 59]CAD5288703.1 conserved hypothetical protein [Halomonas sp. I3]VXB14997.1 conserved hypothetical protein [Halomonas titanicae]|tara:strand:+ start:648 stop:1430 length:783 start_codon:yes stop_codon:yes gene_type:complete